MWLKVKCDVDDHMLCKLFGKRGVFLNFSAGRLEKLIQPPPLFHFMFKWASSLSFFPPFFSPIYSIHSFFGGLLLLGTVYMFFCYFIELWYSIYSLVAYAQSTGWFVCICIFSGWKYWTCKIPFDNDFVFRFLWVFFVTGFVSREIFLRLVYNVMIHFLGILKVQTSFTKVGNVNVVNCHRRTMVFSYMKIK